MPPIQEVVDGNDDEATFVAGFLCEALVAKLVDDSKPEIVFDEAEGGAGSRLVLYEPAADVNLREVIEMCEDGVGLYPNVVSGCATEREDGREPRWVL